MTGASRAPGGIARRKRGRGRAGAARSALLATLAVASSGACDALTGASSYATTAACTGPECVAQCRAQGGEWDLATSTCACASGGGPCGGTTGTCCAGAAPYCVTESTGAERCSPCTEASFECGTVCCEQQVCLNPTLGACGASFGVAGQSCAGGLVCQVPGAGGTVESADCCESIALPGGPFPMGRSLTGKNQCPAAGDCGAEELPEHTVTLAPFKLDRFEVTVGRFRKFVNGFDFSAGLPTGAGGDANVAGSGWPSGAGAYLPSSSAELEQIVANGSTVTWTSQPGLNESRPIVGVSWFVAFAFCAWDGGRLPTEAEWEYAAANGASADLYPWGEAAPTPQLAVYDCSTDPTPCAARPLLPANVGSLPGGANRWGHRDLAGNVSEWTLDSYGPYPSQPTTNYASVTTGFRMIRDGAFDTMAQAPPVADGFGLTLRAAARTGKSDPGVRFTDVGVRCARSP